MIISKQYLSPGHRCRPGGAYQKTTITIHSTGNLHSTAKNERDWLDNKSNTRDASWHYVVGEDIVIQAIPDGEEAWHCGVTAGNRHSLSVEICESGDRKKTLLNAAEFVAMKLKELGLSMNDIKRHYDWTSKNCPRILIDKSFIKGGMDWKWFLKQTESFLEEESDMQRYNNINEIPEWGKATIQKLIDKGAIADKNNLNLTEDMIRTFVIWERYGK